MNLAWEQSWLEQFNDDLDRLMENYTDTFEYEDMNLGVTITNDKPRLRELFKTFENVDPDASEHFFNATRYHGDERGGTLEWTWEIRHKTDFLGLPAAGKTTHVRGLTIHAFDAAGKIIIERSLWDTAALMRQLGLDAPMQLEF
ncbi:ester cyclase [Novosphingobium lentum]|uniref:ester cyclase n=1 Tax=Novosphingobium lentum TaxID=145287 RepID=UPI000830A233|nr:ester cyclase [Novosphingobium lentum]